MSSTLKKQKKSSFDTQNDQITSARFSAAMRDVFLYTTHEGSINLCDMREKSSFLDRSSIVLSYQNTSASVYASKIKSISAASLLADEHTVISRDYLTVKLWDIRTASQNSSQILSKTLPFISSEVCNQMTTNL